MFTVKQLAELAGVTPRTLRYYDEIGILKPSRLGDNGYRLYGEDALLMLQQILLYRDLGLTLDEIKKIVLQPGFNIVAALENHLIRLHQRRAQLDTLIATVGNTLDMIKGNKRMDEKQLFKGFSEAEQAEYEKEAMQMFNAETVKASSAAWKGYSEQKQQAIMDEGNTIYLDFVKAIPFGVASVEAQACVARWRQHMSHFWVPEVDQLLPLAEMYVDDPRFKANFDKIDLRLAAFIRDAVQVYVAGLAHKA